MNFLKQRLTTSKEQKISTKEQRLISRKQIKTQILNNLTTFTSILQTLIWMDVDENGAMRM